MRGDRLPFEETSENVQSGPYQLLPLIINGGCLTLRNLLEAIEKGALCLSHAFRAQRSNWKKTK
jgi:hypothetical protein